MGELFGILGQEYYLDLDNITSSIKLGTTIEDLLEADEPLIDGEEDDDEEHDTVIKYNKSDLIDMTKWEVIKTCIEVLFNENETPDESLGIKSSKDLSIPFRLAFNTLIKNKIIRKNG
jgi:hypothetical protein